MATASRSRMPFRRTTIAYDGNRIAVLALDETLPPTRIMTLRLKHYAIAPRRAGVRELCARSLFAAAACSRPDQ